MPKHIDDKDKADNITKILGDELNQTKIELIALSNRYLTKNLSSSPFKWWQSQQMTLNTFRRESVRIILDSKKTIQRAINRASKEVYLTDNQTKELQKITHNGFADLSTLIYQQHRTNVQSVYNESLKKHNDKMQDLVDVIAKKVNSNQDYGIVQYKNGRNVKWENYMEMKLRTDIQQDIGKNLIEASRAAGFVFFICSHYGDCAPDHCDMQEEGMFYDEGAEITEEIQEYIDSHKMHSIQYAMGEGGGYFTTRPNCRHFFTGIATSSVLGIKTNKELNTYRQNHDLNFNGKYKPEKYDALTKQRANERAIRNAKGKLQERENLLKSVPSNASKEVINALKNDILEAKRNVSVSQRNQRELLEANSFLERNYDREAYRRMISDFRIRK